MHACMHETVTICIFSLANFGMFTSLPPSSSANTLHHANPPGLAYKMLVMQYDVMYMTLFTSYLVAKGFPRIKNAHYA